MAFKANWERSYLREQISEKLILQMLCYFYDEKDINNFHVINNGCANVNVFVKLKNKNNPIVLRIYCRDSDSAYKEKNICNFLKNKIPVPQIYHIAESFGYTFAVVEYLSGKPLRDFLLNNSKLDVSKIMYKVGQTLGVIHKIRFEKSGFFNQKLELKESIMPDELERFCSEILEGKIVNALMPEVQRKKIKNLFENYKEFLPTCSEKSLVHGDFDLSNILVIEHNNELEISGIMDWEFCFSGDSLWDIANMLREAHKCSKEYRQSFLRGLESKEYQLPNGWQITVKLLNIISLLDCLKRSDQTHQLNRIKDIKETIGHTLLNFETMKA